MLFPYTIEMNDILILFEGLHCYENTVCKVKRFSISKLNAKIIFCSLNAKTNISFAIDQQCLTRVILSWDLFREFSTKCSIYLIMLDNRQLYYYISQCKHILLYPRKQCTECNNKMKPLIHYKNTLEFHVQIINISNNLIPLKYFQMQL